MSDAAHRSSLFELLKQRIVGPRRVVLPVSAYGKLPIYKDFLRHNLAGREAQAFKHWLDRGVSKFWACHDPYQDHEIPWHAFLLTFPATGKQILGCLWGSHDHGGLRQFPFAVFVALPVAKALAPLSLIQALDQVVEQASTLRRRLDDLAGLDAFYPLIRTCQWSVELHGDKRIRDALADRRSPTVAALGEHFFDGDDEGWPRLLAFLRRASRDRAGAFAGRLPHTDAVPIQAMASFWCLLVADARRNTRKPLQLFYRPDHPEGGITVLHRDVRPDDIFALHPEMPAYEGIVDLRRTAPQTGAENGTTPPLGTELRSAPFPVLLDHLATLVKNHGAS